MHYEEDEVTQVQSHVNNYGMPKLRDPSSITVLYLGN